MAKKDTSKKVKAATEASVEAPERVASDDVATSPSDPFERFALLGDVFGRWPSMFPTHWPEWLSGETSGFRVEEFMEDDEFVIRGEIPGVDPEKDIDIQVDHGRLSIRAEREQRTESEDGYRSEFRYGSFSRVLPLPEGADADDIRASYSDGILEVRVPIDEEQRTQKKVTVSRG